MHRDGPTPSREAEAASSIRARLDAEIGSVGGTVPTGFQGYARILHPARDRSGHDVRWSAVAAHTGRRMHPLAQWHRLVGLPDDNPYGSGEWPGSPPLRGQMGEAGLAVLVELLAPHTRTPEECWFCVGDGYGWVTGSGVIRGIPSGSDHWESAQRMPPPFPPEVPDGPRVHLPLRDYLLFHGRLVAASHVGHWVTPDWFDAWSPNLFWPEDHTWCVGSEIDFDSTVAAVAPNLSATS